MGWWSGAWQKDIQKEDSPLGNVFVTMLQQLGVKVDKFGGSNGKVSQLTT